MNTATEQPQGNPELDTGAPAATDQPAGTPETHAQIDTREQAAIDSDQRDRRIGLSEWFKQPEHSDDQIALLNRNYEEAKAAHVDAEAKLERLNGEVRRFTEALDAPKELEPLIAAAQAAEVKARVLDGGIAADEAQRVLKVAQRKFDSAISAAREAEIVLPDVRAMVEEQRKAVLDKRGAQWKAEEALGNASAARVMHRGVRSHLTGLLANFGNLQKLADEFGCALPFEIKLQPPDSSSWFKPHEINPEA